MKPPHEHAKRFDHQGKYTQSPHRCVSRPTLPPANPLCSAEGFSTGIPMSPRQPSCLSPGAWPIPFPPTRMPAAAFGRASIRFCRYGADIKPFASLGRSFAWRHEQCRISVARSCPAVTAGLDWRQVSQKARITRSPRRKLKSRSARRSRNYGASRKEAIRLSA